MTSLLASVRTLEEAKLALREGVDIIDLKDPTKGALGALGIEQVKCIVDEIMGRVPISATIGDLPLNAPNIANAVERMQETGVDYIKVGIFPALPQYNGALGNLLTALQPMVEQVKLIAVLFADTSPDFDTVGKFIDYGFSGVMLDTQEKKLGSLTTVMAGKQIETFVKQAKANGNGIVCGLAGSLTLSDIPMLLPYQPDYLGFRAALCEQHDRTEGISPKAIRRIKKTILEFSV